MLAKVLTALAAVVMFVSTVELGHFSARPSHVRPAREFFAPELGLPSVPELGAAPATKTSLTR